MPAFAGQRRVMCEWYRVYMHLVEGQIMCFIAKIKFLQTISKWREWYTASLMSILKEGDGGSHGVRKGEKEKLTDVANPSVVN